MTLWFNGFFGIHPPEVCPRNEERLSGAGYKPVFHKLVSHNGKEFPKSKHRTAFTKDGGNYHNCRNL